MSESEDEVIIHCIRTVNVNARAWLSVQSHKGKNIFRLQVEVVENRVEKRPQLEALHVFFCFDVLTF